MDFRGLLGEQVAGIVHELDDTQFSTKMRGYDAAEVDALLDRVRSIVEELGAAERQANERATLAECQLAEEFEATRAARATAEAGIAKAVAEAAKLVGAAQSDAVALREAAEIEIRHAAEEARGRVLIEIAKLEQQRDALADQVDVTAAHLSAHRTRLIRVVDDFSNLISGIEDRPEGLENLTADIQPQSDSLNSFRSSDRNPGIDNPELTSDLAEPTWASDPNPKSVVRPIRPAVDQEAPAGMSAGGAVGGDQDDLDAFFADDGT